MVRILVVDDSPTSRAAFSDLLGSQPDFKVVGDAADGLEGVQKVRELLPDLVTMDALMPNMDGAEATRQIKEERPRVGVLFVSASVDYIDEATAAGADGYVVKSCEREWLFSEVRRIAVKMQEAKDK